LELYLIRHAQSTNQTLEDRDDIVFDPRLTDLGECQAVLLAEYFTADKERVRFAESGIDRLVCSPMWRALQTTHPLAEALNLTPEVWVEVHEQVLTTDVHPGAARDEILSAFPGYRLPDQITDHGWWQQGSEEASAVMERAIRVAADLWQQVPNDESLAIVSHVRFIDSLLKALLNQLPSKERWFHHGNTGVSRVALSERGIEIRYINRIAHLPPHLTS